MQLGVDLDAVTKRKKSLLVQPVNHCTVYSIVLETLCRVKVKLKLSLCLTKHHAMKAYWGSGGITPRIL
jgi:hypothetical protein